MVEECYADILLVIDYSGSMKSYWGDVMDFVEALIYGLPPILSPTTVRVGVIFFSETAALKVSHMTLSRDNITNRIIKDTYIHKHTNLHTYTHARSHTQVCVCLFVHARFCCVFDCVHTHVYSSVHACVRGS